MSSIILDIIYGAAYESGESSLTVHHVVGFHATGPGTPYDTSLVNHPISPGNGFIIFQAVKIFDQFLGTWILLVVIFSMTDEKNGSLGNLNPVLIGICVIVIGLSFGITSGYETYLLLLLENHF